MSINLSEIMIKQLDVVIEKFNKIKNISKHDDFSDLKEDVVIEFITLSLAAIHRISGSYSQYAKQADKLVDTTRDRYRSTLAPSIPQLYGVIQALKYEINNGFLNDIQEIVHAELFSNYLDMADHLISEGYKDAAAVIIGSTLEEHLRKLCIKYTNIALVITDIKGTRPKKTDTINSDLAREGIYSKLDQKNIMAWLDLRNKAAHGQYNQYTQEQVVIFLHSVRDFIARYPA